jgi:hypothetical protein
MRLHEFSTRQSRLRHLKKVFDQIYRELALGAKRRKKTTKRKPLPPSAPQDNNVGRSVLSARYPTLASTARYMPQRIVAKRSRSKRVTMPRAAPLAAPSRRPKPRAAPTMSAPSKPPSKAAATNQPTKVADVSKAQANQRGGQATVDQRNTKAAVTKNQAVQPPTMPPNPLQLANQVPTQPQLARPPMPRAQQVPNPNVQAWRFANQPPMPRKPQLATNPTVPPKR